MAAGVLVENLQPGPALLPSGAPVVPAVIAPELGQAKLHLGSGPATPSAVLVPHVPEPRLAVPTGTDANKPAIALAKTALAKTKAATEGSVVTEPPGDVRMTDQMASHPGVEPNAQSLAREIPASPAAPVLTDIASQGSMVPEPIGDVKTDQPIGTSDWGRVRGPTSCPRDPRLA